MGQLMPRKNPDVAKHVLRWAQAGLKVLLVHDTRELKLLQDKLYFHHPKAAAGTQGLDGRDDELAKTIAELLRLPNTAESTIKLRRSVLFENSVYEDEPNLLSRIKIFSAIYVKMETNFICISTISSMRPAKLRMLPLLLMAKGLFTTSIATLQPSSHARISSSVTAVQWSTSISDQAKQRFLPLIVVKEYRTTHQKPSQPRQCRN